MEILHFTYALTALLMIVIPIALAILLTRKYQLDGRLWWIGGVVLIGSLLVKRIVFFLATPSLEKLVLRELPVWGQIVIYALFIGLVTGIVEELARYGMFRWWVKTARSWAQVLLTGAGHSGVRAIYLGGIVLLSLLNMSTYRNQDLSLVVQPENLAAAQAQMDAYWSIPWHRSLLPAIEQLLLIPITLAFSLIVLQAVVRKRFVWVWLAVFFHFLVDGIVVFLSQLSWDEFAVMGVLSLFSLASVLIIIRFRNPIIS